MSSTPTTYRPPSDLLPGTNPFFLLLLKISVDINFISGGVETRWLSQTLLPLLQFPRWANPSHPREIFAPDSPFSTLTMT